MTPRRWIAVGAALTVAGLAVAATAPVPGTVGAERARPQQGAGGAAVLLGWIAFGWGIHRFGRADGTSPATLGSADVLPARRPLSERGRNQEEP